MKTLQLSLLGTFEARFDCGPRILESARKGQALLAYLAMARGRSYSRDHLSSLLWGQTGDLQARNSLRQTLFVLRRDLAGFSGLIAKGVEVSLDANSYRADVHDLIDLAQHGHGPSPEVELANIGREFMEGFNLKEPLFQDWLEATRRRCRELTLNLLGRRLHRLADGGDLIAAIDMAQLMLKLEPLQEDIHRTLIRLHLATGHRSRALRQYEECRAILQRELAVSPDRETATLVAEIRKTNALGWKTIDARGSKSHGRARSAVVAVLPFGGSPARRARGLTSSVIHELSAWRQLSVIDRSTMFSYPAEGTTARRLADELDASHVIEGQIGRTSGSLRASVALVDAPTGRNMWTATFVDRSPGPDETGLARRIVARIGCEIDRLDARRVGLERSGRLELWELFQTGCALYDEVGWEPAQQAKEMFQRALHLDPGFSPAMAALARAYHDDFTVHHIDQHSIQRCVEAARHAVEMNNHDSTAHMALSLGACRSHEHRLAVEEGVAAIRLNPSNALAHVVLGNALAFAGKPLLGAARIREGIALGNPDDPFRSFYTQMVARCYLTAGDYHSALRWADKSIRQRADWAFSHFVRASALANLGRFKDAEAAIDRCLANDPECVAREFGGPSARYAKPADLKQVLDGVRQIGIGQAVDP